MTLDTDVDKIRLVEASDGSQVPPASDSESIATGSVDLDTDGDQTVDLGKVDAAERLTILVEFSNDGHIEVHFTDVDSTRIVSRKPADNGDYSVTGGGDVYVETGIATPYVEVDVVDDTAGGTSNQTSFAVYLR